MKQLIRNVHLLTMDAALNSWPEGYLLIEGTKIVARGPMAECPQITAEMKVIEGQGGLLLPGMINTHTHTGMIPFRSLADDVADRLRRFLFPLEEGYMTPDLAAASARYATAEMALSGVTTFSDMYYFEDSLAKAIEPLGVRAFLGQTILDQPTCDAQNSEEALAKTEQFIAKWHKHPLITPMLAPHATNTVQPETLKRIVDMSQKWEAPIMMHVAEMTYEMEFFQETYQQTPLAFLDELGFFACPFILAHGIFVSEGDLKHFATKTNQPKIAHCLGANIKAAKGIAPISAMRAAGWNVGLGTDGPSSGNTLDLFTQMKLVATVHKNQVHERTAFPAHEVVQMATLEGAKVLGIDHQVGSLEVGKEADCIVIDVKRPALFPRFDPYATVVYAASAADVRHVWVAGRQVVHDYQFLPADEVVLRDNLEAEMHDFAVAAQNLLKNLD